MNNRKLKQYQPVIIIGAPRSGTNMLRDTLVRFPSIGTWPCDEINYIWRHGNIFHPSDIISPDLAKDHIKQYIRKKFERISKQQNVDFVVEKTCANSLRVDFVNQILPEAKYIFIVRNGIDVVASAMKRWKAKLDIPYVLSKARYIPFSDLPYYSLRYFSNRIYRLLSPNKRLSFWGPQLEDMQSILKSYPLEQVCALQWQQCVEKSEKDFSHILPNRIIRIKYEDIVMSPSEELEKIMDFLHLKKDPKLLAQNILNISKNSINKGLNELNHEQIQKIKELINPTLKKYGYQ